ncbi:FecR domain-containing protein [Pseudorhodoferax sp.]|uniref:FecR domain-containing protein n=1 Tax=Pseudorhodoferax sp. TaxID=1993553 RepID=UPI0039E54EE6
MLELTPAEGTAAPSARGEAEVRKEAVAWYARLCSGEATEADRDAWKRWHAAHPDHQRAWRHFEALQATLDRVPGHIGATTLQAARRSRRRVLLGLAGLAGSGVLASLSWRLSGGAGGLRTWLADYRTGPGEQRSVVLADGSQLTLNTRTAVDLAFDAARRLVVLREGEILVRTARPGRGSGGAKDARPFTVQTPQGRILALGTRFTVRSDEARTVVGVLEDAVEIRAAEAPGQALRLEAGQQAVFTRDRVGTPQPVEPVFVDWPGGSLVVDGWRLEDVVRELARYRRGRLDCDPAVAGVRVSGVFPLGDTDKALAVITRAFPVRASGMTRYWLTLVPA